MRRGWWLPLLGLCLNWGDDAGAQAGAAGRPVGLPGDRRWDASPPGGVDLGALARRWSPDVYQDVDDSQAAEDLITDLDHDGDQVMTINGEHLAGRSCGAAGALGRLR